MDNTPDTATATVPVQPDAAGDGPGRSDGEEQRRLQDILPEINNLAQKVGGLKHLAEIIATLSDSEES